MSEGSVSEDQNATLWDTTKYLVESAEFHITGTYSKIW